jgi:hypothetical protein
VLEEGDGGEDECAARGRHHPADHVRLTQRRAHMII